MRVAAIDVGTNSTRLLVAEAGPSGFRSLERRNTITRLGEGVDRRRALSSEAVTRTLAVIADYAATCGEFGVNLLRVTGTSAVRDARNRDEFFLAVEALTGSAPQMLTGEEEGRATFLGACADLDGARPVLVFDIGGGSTEFIAGRGAPEKIVSLDIGCVRMFEKHLHSDPPAPAEIEALRGEIRSAIEPAKEQLGLAPDALLVGVAGTVTQLALLKAGLATYDAEVTHHMVLTHSDVRAVARRLASLPYAQRSRVKGLEQGRVDVIVAGAEILLAVMDSFGATEVLVSEKDILDGLVLETLSTS